MQSSYYKKIVKAQSPRKGYVPKAATKKKNPIKIQQVGAKLASLLAREKRGGGEGN